MLRAIKFACSLQLVSPGIETKGKGIATMVMALSHNTDEPCIHSGTTVELAMEVWVIVCSYLQASTPDLIHLAGTCCSCSALA